MAKLRKFDQETVAFSRQFLAKVDGSPTQYKLLTAELNRKNMLGGNWGPGEAYQYIFHYGGNTVPRKHVRRGYQDKGIPEDLTVPDGCVSEDDAIRYIDIVRQECPPDKPLWDYTANCLNENNIHTTVAKVMWRPKSTEMFYRKNTQDEATNRLRDKFQGHQIWPVDEVARTINSFKDLGYTNGSITDWFNRERIIHNRWKLAKPTWNKQQVSSLVSTKKDQLIKKGRPLQKPRQPALDFVKQNPKYNIIMPDDIILLHYDMLRRGFEWTADMLATYLNRNHYVRGNYSRGSHEFTGTTIVNIFARRGLQISQDEPEWVRTKLDQRRADTEAAKEDQAAEPEAEAVPVVQETDAKAAAGPMLTLPELTKTTDQYTAKAQVLVGPDKLTLTLEYDGEPDALIAALLEKLFGMKVKF